VATHTFIFILKFFFLLRCITCDIQTVVIYFPNREIIFSDDGGGITFLVSSAYILRPITLNLMCMLGREYMRVETVLYDTLEAESKNKDDSRHKD
jgi:hypothetical protein